MGEITLKQEFRRPPCSKPTFENKPWVPQVGAEVLAGDWLPHGWLRAAFARVHQHRLLFTLIFRRCIVAPNGRSWNRNWRRNGADARGTRGRRVPAGRGVPLLRAAVYMFTIVFLGWTMICIIDHAERGWCSIWRLVACPAVALGGMNLHGGARRQMSPGLAVAGWGLFWRAVGVSPLFWNRGSTSTVASSTTGPYRVAHRRRVFANAASEPARLHARIRQRCRVGAMPWPSSPNTSRWT
ncbi:MAG: hypothetical protein U0792_04320 [Gemmataceae bacterium]